MKYGHSQEGGPRVTQVPFDVKFAQITRRFLTSSIAFVAPSGAGSVSLGTVHLFSDSGLGGGGSRSAGGGEAFKVIIIPVLSLALQKSPTHAHTRAHTRLTRTHSYTCTHARTHAHSTHLQARTTPDSHTLTHSRLTCTHTHAHPTHLHTRTHTRLTCTHARTPDSPARTPQEPVSAESADSPSEYSRAPLLQRESKNLSIAGTQARILSPAS